MIQELIQELARNLVLQNAGWLDSMRSVGYMNTFPDGQAIIDQNGNEIGITDSDGNSGYIRFLSDQNFSTESIRGYGSCARGTRYSFRLRLVVAAKTETPENLVLLLSTQLNSAQFSAKKGTQNIKVVTMGGGSNSASIHRIETKKEQIQEPLRLVYIDFNLVFEWMRDCDQIPIKMNCDNCSSTYDFGCIQHCDELETGITAGYTGLMTMNTEFNGIMVSQAFDVTTGEEIKIPMDQINENYTYSIQLRDEDGEVVEFEKGSPSETYDCLKITTKP